MAKLEHVNITVSDPAKTAEQLCQLFDWHIRWQGPSQMGGNTVHVGTEDDYVAVYTYDGKPPGSGRTGSHKGGLNHIGVVVENLDATEKRINEMGFDTFNHGSYEPGRRFYFLDHDGVEFEVVSYKE